MRGMWRAMRAMAVATPVGATAAGQCASPSSFVTPGTTGGPIPGPTRDQPANPPRSGGRSILIDAGDGAAEQLARACVPRGDALGDRSAAGTRALIAANSMGSSRSPMISTGSESTEQAGDYP